MHTQDARIHSTAHALIGAWTYRDTQEHMQDHTYSHGVAHQSSRSGEFGGISSCMLGQGMRTLNLWPATLNFDQQDRRRKSRCNFARSAEDGCPMTQTNQNSGDISSQVLLRQLASRVRGNEWVIGPALRFHGMPAQGCVLTTLVVGTPPE